MSGRISASPIGVGETLAHDAMCLRVHDDAYQIANRLLLDEDEIEAGLSIIGVITAELEARVGLGWVDVMIRRDGAPLFTVEVKSDKDQQHPSAWYRQVKLYAADASPAVPLLAVGHDLSALQRRYLHTCQIRVLDLRTMSLLWEVR